MGLPESRAADVPCCLAALRGATDLASTLTRRGMRTILIIGVPKAVSLEAHPIVVAFKSRTIPADQAVALITFCKPLANARRRLENLNLCSLRNAHQGIGMRYCIVRKTR
jgi:hypothetical protein